MQQKKKTIAMKSVGRAAEVGQLIQVPVHMVDRGPLDPTHIIGCVVETEPTERPGEEGIHWYTVALQCNSGDCGILSYRIHGYSGHVLKSTAAQCAPGLVKVLHMDKGERKKLPRWGVREAVHRGSMFGGQGVVRCNCQSGCQTKRCKCFQEDRKCTKFCHTGHECKNMGCNDSDEEADDEVVGANPENPIPEEGHYAALEILKTRTVRQQRQCLIRWAPDPELGKFKDSWVVEEDVTQDLLDAYNSIHCEMCS